MWWFERQHIYPWLSRMAMDYLSIPGVYHCLILLYISSDYCGIQLHLSTLNVFSARVGFFYRIYIAAFQLNQHVLSCVLEHGA